MILSRNSGGHSHPHVTGAPPLTIPDAAWYGTAPLSVSLPPSDQPLTFFAHGSCADQAKPQHFWNTVQSVQPQLFIFNGDIVYGDCASAASCDDLPLAWRDLFNNANFQSASATLPMMGILDDHDYGKNDCDASWEGKGYAKSIFLERFNISADDVRRSRDGLYWSRTFGPAGVCPDHPPRHALVPPLPAASDCTDWRVEDCARERYAPYPKPTPTSTRSSARSSGVASSSCWSLRSCG